MSPVIAGIVDMMKEVNNNLSAADYKKILIETGRQVKYDGYTVKHVVDVSILFVIAGAILLSALTVFYHSVRAAIANPVDSLRHE